MRKTVSVIVAGALVLGVYFVYLYQKDVTTRSQNTNVTSTTTQQGIQLLPNSYYAVDATHVYYSTALDRGPDKPGFIIPGADPASFSVIDETRAKDVNHVYKGNDIVSNADPATFVLLLDSNGQRTQFSKDKNVVYLGNESRTIKNADPDTFSLVYSLDGKLNNEYVKDKSMVWYINQCEYMCGANYVPYEVVTGADSESFMGVDGGSKYDAQDKNHRYLNGELVL